MRPRLTSASPFPREKKGWYGRPPRNRKPCIGLQPIHKRQLEHRLYQDHFPAWHLAREIPENPWVARDFREVKNAKVQIEKMEWLRFELHFTKARQMVKSGLPQILQPTPMTLCSQPGTPQNIWNLRTLIEKENLISPKDAVAWREITALVHLLDTTSLYVHLSTFIQWRECYFLWYLFHWFKHYKVSL